MDAEISEGVCQYVTSNTLGPLAPVYFIAGFTLTIGALALAFLGYTDRIFAALKHENKIVRMVAMLTLAALASSFGLEIISSTSESILDWLQSEYGRCVQSAGLFTASAALTCTYLTIIAFWALAKYPPSDISATKKKTLHARALQLKSLLIPFGTLLVGFWIGALTANLYLLFWIPIAAAGVVYVLENRKPGARTLP